jgi:hypothetical protein
MSECSERLREPQEPDSSWGLARVRGLQFSDESVQGFKGLIEGDEVQTEGVAEVLVSLAGTVGEFQVMEGVPLDRYVPCLCLGRQEASYEGSVEVVPLEDEGTVEEVLAAVAVSEETPRC